MTPTTFHVSERERTLCADWHGGQYSMLYAIASTGALTLGRSGFSDDSERMRDLLSRLARECAEVVRIATEDDDRSTAEAMGERATIAATEDDDR